MLRERLKQEIDTLDESQLSKIAAFIDSTEAQAQKKIRTVPFWQRATPIERSRDFRQWVEGLS